MIAKATYWVDVTCEKGILTISDDEDSNSFDISQSRGLITKVLTSGGRVFFDDHGGHVVDVSRDEGRVTARFGGWNLILEESAIDSFIETIDS